MSAIVLILVILGGIGSLVGALHTGLFGPKAQARRRLARGRVHQIVEGEVVTLVGTVEPLGELLEAPLSGTACVAFAVHVDLHDVPAEGARTRKIVDVIRVEQLVPFRVVTPSGTVEITAPSVESSIPLAPLVPHDRRREQAFLRAQGRSPDLALAGPFVEYAVAPGTKLRVQGVAVLDAPDMTVERDYRSTAPSRIRLVAHADHPLTIGLP